MDDIDRLVEAIQQRRVVVLDYAGAGERTVHPHALYLTETGQPILEGLQVAGATGHDQQLPAWRALRVALISSVLLTAKAFDVSRLYNPAAARYRRAVVCC